MAKIKTALKGSFNTTLSTSVAQVAFDADGIADVSQETADYLKSNFPDVYYDADGEAPIPNSGSFKNPAQDESVRAFARGHNNSKNAERAGHAPVIATSSKMDEARNPSKKVLDQHGKEISPADINKDGKVDEKDLSAVHKAYSAEKKAKVKEMKAELQKLTSKQIVAKLKEAGKHDDDTKGIIRKSTLVGVAAKKLIE